MSKYKIEVVVRLKSHITGRRMDNLIDKLMGEHGMYRVCRCAVHNEEPENSVNIYRVFLPEGATFHERYNDVPINRLHMALWRKLVNIAKPYWKGY
jgi:hypothetical protein